VLPELWQDFVIKGCTVEEVVVEVTINFSKVRTYPSASGMALLSGTALPPTSM
jgi:hypothetical protein